MPHPKSFVRLSLLLFAAIGFSGCASTPDRHLAVPASSTLPVAYQNGIAFLKSVKINEVDLRLNFPVVQKRGIIPTGFSIWVTNGSRTAFDFSAANVEVSSGGQRIDFLSAEDILDVSSHPKETFEVREQFALREESARLKRNTIRDGEKAHGFIFLSPDGIKIGDKIHVLVRLPQETHEFLFDVLPWNEDSATDSNGQAALDEGPPVDARPDKASSGKVGEAALAKASGTGTIVSTDGVILTAAHVVRGADSLRVISSQGATLKATLLGLDEANDVAVLKINGDQFSAIPVLSSKNVRLGQEVETIGFPNVQLQGFNPKVTRGEISSITGFADDPREWQISVPVQPGNSGGPLLDRDGRLIGIVVAKFGLNAVRATGDLPQNVNFAVKSAYALPLLEPYLDKAAPEPKPMEQSPKFEDMVARAQQSVVLILVY